MLNASYSIPSIIIFSKAKKESVYNDLNLENEMKESDEYWN